MTTLPSHCFKLAAAYGFIATMLFFICVAPTAQTQTDATDVAAALHALQAEVSALKWAMCFLVAHVGLILALQTYCFTIWHRQIMQLLSGRAPTQLPYRPSTPPDVGQGYMPTMNGN